MSLSFGFGASAPGMGGSAAALRLQPARACVVIAVVCSFVVSGLFAAAPTAHAQISPVRPQGVEAESDDATTPEEDELFGAEGDTMPSELESVGEEEGAADREAFKGVESMTVEARRRSENLQKIGESVSTFSSTEILDKGLTNFNDLQYNVPSLFSGGGLTKITLRGVGSEVVGPGIDPGFAVHVNGVFSARETTGLINYYDIERVDVLRGPQGTLWGRNSTGGAVNIVTKKAEYEFATEGDFEYEWFDSGSHGALIRGMVNMPIVENKLAFRAALLTQFTTGQFEIVNDENDQRLGDVAAATLRASLRWDPHEDVRVDLIGSWLASDGDGGASKFRGDYTTPPGNRWVGAGAGFDYRGAESNPSNHYKGTANEPQTSDATVYTATLLVNWEPGDFELESITGYQATDFHTHTDYDTSNLPIAVLDLWDDSRQLSQELILNSTWEHPVNYTVGTIYQYDWTPQTRVRIDNAQDDVAVIPFQLVSLVVLPPPDPPFSLVDGCPPDCPPTKLPGDPYDDFIDAYAKIDNHVFGVYANLSWEVVETLTLSAGGRFSLTYRDWRDTTVAQSYFETLTTTTQSIGIQIRQVGIHDEKTWTAGTYKFGVEWEATNENLLWASVGTGSRAGGFNFGEERSFDAEYIFAVEAGVKNTFFDNRFVLNVSGFWYDWDDPQLAATQDGLPITTNTGSATSYGIEVDLFAIPIDDLAIDASFGWLEAYYDSDFFQADITIQDFTQGDPRRRTTPININRNRLPRSPRFTASLGAEYTFDVGRWGTVTPRVDAYYRDEVTFRQFGNSKDTAAAYTRTDARIIWRSSTAQFWAEVYVRNIENEAVKTNQQIVASIYRTNSIAAPRSTGFRIGYVY
jgi:iron complex outermembrane receptor protein